MTQDVLHDAEEKMKKAVDVLRKNIAGIRTGRASPVLLDPITVEYYGSQVPLKQLAGISVPEARTIIIQAYDKSTLPAIEKAILKSQLGITPKTEAGRIILNIPPLTEERRRDLVKVIKKEAEESKISLRNIRRDAIEHLKKEKEEKKITEDIEKHKEEEAQKMVTRFSDEIDKLIKTKEGEVLDLPVRQAGV